MTPKQIATLMAQYLGERDLLATTSLGGNQAPTSDQTEKLQTFLNCINDVVQMIAVSYFPLKTKTTLSSETKTFSYSSFPKTILQIISVRDTSTKAKLRFEIMDDSFTTSSNNVEVVYNYQPNYAQAFNSNLDVSKYYVTPRMVALGAVARYYLFEGLFNESLAWNNMFERAVLVAKTPKHALYINKRSWF